MKHPTPNLRIKRTLLALTGLTFCLTGTAVESTNSPAPTRLTFDSFRTVSDRNIFNPNRYARSTGRSSRSTPSTPASRVESLSLVGVIAYEKGYYAFFDGTSGDYRQAVQTGATVGEYKVTRITSDIVQLAHGTNTYDLKVGMQMRREDEGDWFLSEGSDAPRKRVVSTRTRTRGGARGEGSPGGAGEEMTGGNEPEVIVVENESQPEANGTAQTNNENGNGNSEAAPTQADNGDSGVTDPVLRALMERRRNALNR
ncbi:MAG: hypothetical protein QM813_26910 [Verrucomicrobiota bacterium]